MSEQEETAGRPVFVVPGVVVETDIGSISIRADPAQCDEVRIFLKVTGTEIESRLEKDRCVVREFMVDPY